METRQKYESGFRFRSFSCLFCVLLSCVSWFAFSLPAAAGDVEAERSRTRDRVAAQFRFGPFFEYRRSELGGTFWAVRPFYSQVRDPASDTVVRDFVWPVATYHDHDHASWWRFLIAYGDARDLDPSWSFYVFPLWFNGKDRAGKPYWGAFPLYGRHPHLLFMDDARFLLFPFHLDYKIHGVRRDYILWPLFCFEQDDAESSGLWPFYSHARLRESTHSYAAWPFATWASYDEDRDTPGAGTSWMAWPFYGRIRRARERQDLYLPPFISYVRTDRATRLRAPWPLFERFRSDYQNKLTVWPFYESVDGFPLSPKGTPARTLPREEKTRTYGWWLVVDSTLETAARRESRFTVFPFWSSETLVDKAQGTNAADRVVGSYRRLWPFWASETGRDGLNRQRVLELNPIRHSGGIERNWAPFWTFWSCEDQPDGRTLHTFFWGLIKYHTSAR